LEPLCSLKFYSGSGNKKTILIELLIFPVKGKKIAVEFLEGLERADNIYVQITGSLKSGQIRVNWLFTISLRF
jgi:hypothetical protein